MTSAEATAARVARGPAHLAVVELIVFARFVAREDHVTTRARVEYLGHAVEADQEIVTGACEDGLEDIIFIVADICTTRRGAVVDSDHSETGLELNIAGGARQVDHVVGTGQGARRAGDDRAALDRVWVSQVRSQLRLVEHTVGVHPGRGVHLEPCRRGGELVPRDIDLGSDHRPSGALADHDHVVVGERVGPLPVLPDHRTDQVAHTRIVVGRERELHKTPGLAGATDRVIRAQLVVLDHATGTDRFDRHDRGHRVHGHGQCAGVGGVPGVVTDPRAQRVGAVTELAGDDRVGAVTVVCDTVWDQLGAVVLEDQQPTGLARDGQGEYVVLGDVVGGGVALVCVTERVIDQINRRSARGDRVDRDAQLRRI